MKTLFFLLVILCGALGYEGYRLFNENAGLRVKLKEAEASLAAAGQNPGAQAQSDLEYQAVKKEYSAGALLDSGDKEPDTGRPVMKRVSARWLVYFTGVQTKRQYPPFEVKEASYAQFTEGGVYTRQDINSARK